MAFCRNCGAQIADESAQCAQCGGVPGQYYQPVPYGPPPRQSPDEDVGKALGIVALIIVIVIIVTVVLAAVLYVMVIDFGDTSSVEYAPVGTWNYIDTTSTTAELQFGTFSNEVAPTDIMIYVREGGTNLGTISFTSDTAPSPASLVWVGGPAGVSAEYHDLNSQGGNINAGDYIVLEGLDPDTNYSVELYHIPSDMIISMMGDYSFTTEP